MRVGGVGKVGGDFDLYFYFCLTNFLFLVNFFLTSSNFFF